MLTPGPGSANILFARYKKRVQDTERYRSGHNEAVLKTVCPNGHMGSNPILSALFHLKRGNRISYIKCNSAILEKYPRGRRGSPGKGVGREKRREGSTPSFSAKWSLSCRLRFALLKSNIWQLNRNATLKISFRLFIRSDFKHRIWKELQRKVWTNQTKQITERWTKQIS